jgi:hypothetical protein
MGVAAFFVIAFWCSNQLFALLQKAAGGMGIAAGISKCGLRLL